MPRADGGLRPPAPLLAASGAARVAFSLLRTALTTKITHTRTSLPSRNPFPQQRDACKTVPLPPPSSTELAAQPIFFSLLFSFSLRHRNEGCGPTPQHPPAPTAAAVGGRGPPRKDGCWPQPCAASHGCLGPTPRRGTAPHAASLLPEQGPAPAFGRSAARGPCPPLSLPPGAFPPARLTAAPGPGIVRPAPVWLLTLALAQPVTTSCYVPSPILAGMCRGMALRRGSFLQGAATPGYST